MPVEFYTDLIGMVIAAAYIGLLVRAFRKMVLFHLLPSHNVEGAGGGKN